MPIIIQSGEYMLGVMNSLVKLGKSLSKKATTDLAIPLAEDVLSGLINNIASNAASNVTYKFEKNNKRKRNCKSRKMIQFIHFK